MENPIVKIFNDISDDELKQAIKEIKEDEIKGIIRIGGVLRKYADITHNSIGVGNMSMHLFLTETNLLKEAAFRWIK